MKREIVIDPSPVLRQPAEKVESFDMELQTIIDDMVETMRANNGIGLAAPQIGESKQVVACELESEKETESKNDSIYDPFPLTVICNPEIIQTSREKCKLVEGCLSFPGRELIVRRPKNITIKGLDRYGKKLEIKAGKLLARVLQHETDHLNSTLMIDYLHEIDIVMFGGGEFALKTIEYIHHDQQYRLKAIFTSKQNTKIRGESVDLNPVKLLAKKLKIKIIEIDNLSQPEIIDQVKKLKPDLGVVVDFGLLIPQQIIDIPVDGILNIHPSLLPKYRGATPIQSTILGGDRYAGVTIIKINAGLDAGDILSQLKVRLKGKETFQVLSEYLSESGASLFLDTVPYYLTGEIRPKKQRQSKVSYTTMLSKADGEVFERDDPALVEKKIRAYYPWPGVYIIKNDLRIMILAAHFDKEKNLVVDRVKPAGKKEMQYSDFISGYKTKLTFGKNIDKLESV